MLDVLRPAATRDLPEGTPLQAVQAGGPHRPINGQMIVVSATMPTFAAYLHVAYVSSDGSVTQLMPGPGFPERVYAPGERIELGHPPPGFSGWQVGPPFGTDMIVLVASSTPLFHGPLPAQMGIGKYPDLLGQAMDVVRAGDGAVSPAAIPIDAGEAAESHVFHAVKETGSLPNMQLPTLAQLARA